MEATRSAYAALLEGVPEDAFDLPSRNPAWTVREVLYHMSLAPRFLIADVRMITVHRWVAGLVGLIVPQRFFHWLNERYTRRSARNANHRSLADGYERAHRAALRALEMVSEAQLDRSLTYPPWDPLLAGDVTVARLFHYIKDHFESHAQDLAEVVSQRRLPTGRAPPEGNRQPA